MKVKNDIHINLAKVECQELVLLDLFAAFYTNDHETFSHRLSTWYGIGASALR